MRKDYNSGKREDWIEPPRNVNRNGNNAGCYEDQHKPQGNNGNKTTNPQGNNGNSDEPNTSANIGWLFYRDYYRGLEDYDPDKNFSISEWIKTEDEIKKELEKQVAEHKKKAKKNFLDKNQKNYHITSSEFLNFSAGNCDICRQLETKINGIKSFTMEVLPPGLLIGSGISHGVPGPGDFELGFQFDYTTGLPVIPGSSVKGVLRSMFPSDDDAKKEAKEKYIKSLLGEEEIDDVVALAKSLFDHEVESTSNFPVFFDAIVCRGVEKKQQDRNNNPKNQGKKGDILGSDYITPHDENPLKNPTPIQFMKVLPGVRFKFFFKLPEDVSDLKRDVLISLFIKILEDVGVGAKTNVGYGHLKRIEYKQHSL